MQKVLISTMLLALLTPFINSVFSQDAGAEKITFQTLLPAEEEAEKTVDDVPWEPVAYDAYAKAVSANQPLIVLVTQKSVQSEKKLSERCLAELKADRLVDFHDKAIFLHVEIPSAGAERPNDFGMSIVRSLKLTEVPTICFLAPNPVMFNEAYRMEGYFTVDQIKHDLPKGIEMAMQTKHTYAPQSPEELIAQFNAAHQAGDFAKYSCCFAAPLRGTLWTLMNEQTSALAARNKLLETIDKQFGPQTDRLPFIEDSESAAGVLRETTGVELVEALAADGKTTVRVRYTILERTGKLTKLEMTFPCVQEHKTWRLLPENHEEIADSALRRAETLQQMRPLLDKLAERVSSGQYETATAARLHTEEVYYSLRAVISAPSRSPRLAETPAASNK